LRSRRSKSRKTLPSSSDASESVTTSTSMSSDRSSQQTRTQTPISEPVSSQPSKTKKTGPSLTQTSTGFGSRLRKKKNLDPMAQFHKKITIRLNKITMDNFDTLAGQLEDIFDAEITNTEQLTKLVTLIFEKTVQEHVYGPLYAKLCVELSSKEKYFDEMVITQYGSEVRQVDFKNVLVKVCQAEFQKGKRPPQFTSDMDAQDRENEKIKVKKILLGTMKFIGELYLSELLPPRVMTLCLKHLVSPPGGKPSEDDIEGACTLLNTVGPRLDNEERLNRAELSKYYGKLGSIGRSGQYAPRIKILVQNLVELRKKNWSDSRTQKVEGPKALNKNKVRRKQTTDIYGDMEEGYPMMMGMEDFIGRDDDGMESITAAIVPINASVIAQSNREFHKRSRWGKKQGSNSGGQTETRSTRRQKKSGGRTRLLLQTEEDEDAEFAEEKYDEFGYGGGYDDNNMAAQPAIVSDVLGIGRKKSRMALSASSARPCDDGKTADEDKMYDIMGNYLNVKANAETTIAEIVSYKMENRVKFILSTIQRAIDGDKGERLSQLIPKLLDEYILLSSELDEALIEFFKGYTFEDNPQINKLTPKLLAPLLVDNELDFSDLLQWILLDTRDNQPDDDMLKFYDGDGVRNLIRNSKTITKALDLLGYLLKELKEVAFDDSEYTKKLLIEHNFAIDSYMDQSDLANKESVQQEWVKKYGLTFAF